MRIENFFGGRSAAWGAPSRRAPRKKDFPLPGGQGKKPPSDEGGGICEANDGGRDKSQSSPVCIMSGQRNVVGRGLAPAAFLCLRSFPAACIFVAPDGPYPFCPFGTFPPDRGNRPRQAQGTGRAESSRPTQKRLPPSRGKLSSEARLMRVPTGVMRLTSAPSSVICSANATFPPVGGRQRPAPSEKFPAANLV